jgi:hypothetical protein
MRTRTALAQRCRIWEQMDLGELSRVVELPSDD